MLPQSRARWIVVAATLAALCLRLGFALGYWVNRPLTHDEREYLGLARSLAQGRGLAHDEAIEIGTGQRFGRAPAYPAFLAAIGAGSIPDPASSPARVKIAQSVIGAAAVLLIALIAWRAAGPRAGATAAAIAAVYPSLVWSPAYVLSETLYSFVALAAALVLQIAVDRSQHDAKAGMAMSAAAGALVGSAVLVRPAMLFFIPLALLWLLRRRRAAMAVLMIAAFVAVVGPWTLRNWRVYGRFVLVASEGGVTFWTGNHPLATGEGDLAANPAIKEAEIAFRRQHPGLTPEELEPLYYRDALRTIANDPVWWLGLLARKAFYTVVPIGPSYALHSLRYRAASTLPYLMIVPFAVVGARRLWRAPSRPAAAFLLGAAAVLVNLLFFPQERFRIPVIDPVLIVCASAAARRLADYPSSS
jgi:4-amino-4-deoxy-L-arabinose transferase-like glycosyltransferase